MLKHFGSLSRGHQQEGQSRSPPKGQQPPKEKRKEPEIPEPEIPDVDAHAFAPPSIS